MSAIVSEFPERESEPQLHAVPPHVHVLQLMMGMWHAQIVAAAARFGIADLVASGVHDVESLAQDESGVRLQLEDGRNVEARIAG